MDDRELLILNPEPFVWQHKDSKIALPYTVSKFFFDIDMGYFQIKEGRGGSGARRFPYLIENITIKVGNGAIEGPFPSDVALLVRLRQLNYPGFIEMVNAMGLISLDANNILAIGSDGLLYVPNGGEASTTYIADGTNTTVTGSGTFIDPYQINAEGGGGSQNLQQTLENGYQATGKDIELTSVYDDSDPFDPKYIGGNVILINPTDLNAKTVISPGVTQYSDDNGVDVTRIGRGSVYTQNAIATLGLAGSSLDYQSNTASGGTKISFEDQTETDVSNFRIPIFGDEIQIAATREWVEEQGYSTGGSTPTELTAVPSPTGVVINSSTQLGAGATIGLTDGTNAGLLSPAEKTKLANQSGTNSGDNTPNSTSQPLDSDLTAIAALTTDSFGRGVLTQTSAANLRTYIGAGTGNGTVTSVTGVSGETTVATGTTTPVIGIASAYTAARDAVANGKVTQTITNGVTTTAPSEDAVFDALALKANLASPTFTGTVTIPSAGLSITGSSGNTYYLRADGTQSGLPFSNTVQANLIGTDNGVNAPITNATQNRQAFWNLQKQILFLQMLNVVQSVTTYALPITNNQVYVTHTGALATYTLPTLANGTAIQYTIINMGSGVVTINSNAGGNDIFDSGTSSATATVLAGQTAIFYGNGSKFVIL